MFVNKFSTSIKKTRAKLKNIEKIANRKIIIVLGIILLFFMLYLFPTYQAEINEIADNKVQLLDVRFSYSKTDVDETFEGMGYEGRKIYQFILGFIDMIYPIIYGLLLFLLLVKLTEKFSNYKLKLICFIPMIAGLFDYIENFGISRMLNNYPLISELNVNFASIATSMKWFFVFVSLILVLIFSIRKLLFNSRMNRK